MIVTKLIKIGKTVNMAVLPNQEKIIGCNIKSENLEVDILINSILKYPVNTVFVSSEYEMLDTNTIKLTANSHTPILDYEGKVAKLDNIVDETRKEIMDTAVNYYLINNVSIADQMINVYSKHHNHIINKTERLQSLLSESTSVFLANVTVTYPCPTIEKNGFYIEPNKWNLLIRNALRKKSTILIGHSGCGKTEIVNLIGEALNKTVFHQDMGTIQDTQSALLGVHRLNSEGVSEFETAPFVDYIQSGQIINLDELSRSPITAGNSLFPCLDRRKYLPLDIAGSKDVRQVPVHPETMFFATANLGNEYSGTNTIDRALLDRFMVVELDFPSPENEEKILMKRTGLDKPNATAITTAINTIRKAAEEDDLSTTVSTRHCLEMAELVVDGFSLKTAFHNVIYPLFDKQERVKINSMLAAWT
jgi:MoxR-like ATPase